MRRGGDHRIVSHGTTNQVLEASALKTATGGIVLGMMKANRRSAGAHRNGGGDCASYAVDGERNQAINQ